MNVLTLMRKISDEPRAGSRVILYLKSGLKIPSNCTQMITREGSYMQYYDSKTRMAVDFNSIEGWMPLGATP